MKYIPGTSETERNRLQIQAKLFDAYALRFLKQAGMEQGRSVLDIGTGAGDVALLAATHVGTAGKVVGVDIEEDMIAHARARAADAGLEQVSFVTTSALLEEIEGTFDVVFARLVLLFQPDQRAFLSRAAKLVRPGGALAIIDTAWEVPAFWSCPALDVYDRYMDQLVDVIGKLGIDRNVGARLVPLFAEAGLAEPQMSAELLTGGETSGIAEYNLLTGDVLFEQARAKSIPCPTGAEQQSRRDEILQVIAKTEVQLFGPCLIGAILRL